MLTARLLAFSILLGGLRDPRLFAFAGAAAWGAIWLKRPPLGPAAYWLPWLAWALISALASSQPLAGLPVLARWSTVLACASLAASWKPPERAQWLRAFLIVAAGVAVAALATGAGHGWTNQMTGVLPPYSNYSAFVLTGAAAAAAAWILHPRGPKGQERTIAAAAIALYILCLILGHSRGAWLGLGAAATVWSTRRWGARAAAAAAVAAVLSLGALAIGKLPAPLENVLFKKYRLNAEARPRIWRAASAIASAEPWLGTGPGNFAVGFRLRPVALENGAARWSMSTDYAHSELLQAGAETGWAGLALWLLGALAALRALISRADDDPVREAAAIAATGLSAHLLVDNMLQIPALAALWLSALALSCAPTTGGRRWPKAAVLAGAALALVSWIPKSLADANPARAAVLFPADPSRREDLAYASKLALEADAHWAQAQQLSPFNAIYPWRRGQIAGALGHWAAAESLSARAIEAEPGFMRARLLRIEALSHLGRAREARAELDAFLKADAGRGTAAALSGYDRTIWQFDKPEHDRAASLVGR